MSEHADEIAAFRDWALNEDGFPGAEWLIRRYAARALFESLESRDDDVVRAAQAFMDTMVIRPSLVEGRDVPRGFTSDSNKAVVALFDALKARPGHMAIPAESGQDASSQVSVARQLVLDRVNTKLRRGTEMALAYPGATLDSGECHALLDELARLW
jgi:hypothetical protein